MRPYLASFGFFTLFCSSIIYFSPPSFGQLDKEYNQQQNQNNQYKNWCSSLRRNSTKWFKLDRVAEYFIANIGGKSTLVMASNCEWRKVLGKTYKYSYWSDMFKLEGGSIVLYRKEFGSVKRIDYAYSISPNPQEWE